MSTLEGPQCISRILSAYGQQPNPTGRCLVLLNSYTNKRDKIIYHWCEEVVGLFIRLLTDHLIKDVAQLLLPGWRQPLENWRLPKAPARPEEEQSGHNHCGCQSSRERAVYLRQIEVRPSLLGISDSFIGVDFWELSIHLLLSKFPGRLSIAH